ncbi:putative calcium-dependent channel, 7TM region phosphate [Helianthus anomalus]
MMMSKFEGFLSISGFKRRCASRYYLFKFVNVFLGSIIVGAAFEQLSTFLNQPASRYVNTGEPQTQFYFLIGLVYAVVTPLLIPFILVLFGLAFVVYRHQVINVYNPKYESRAAFWPDVHGRYKHAAASTPVLLALPVLTMGFRIYCKGRFEPAFTRYPLQEAMNKDTLERVKEPNLNLKGYLEHAYIHPVFKDDCSDGHYEDETPIVPTKRHTRPETSRTNEEEILQEKHKPE